MRTILYFVLIICMSIVTKLNGQRELETTFMSKGFELEGTITLPNMSSNSPNSYPVVLLVHGSGPVDRNSSVRLIDGNSQCLYPALFGNTIEIFKDIAYYLAEQGIASFRYDKRSYSFGPILDPINTTVDDFIDDIESAALHLKEIEQLDIDNLFLIGHSQGSSLIPEAAQRLGQVRGLISLAGATTPIDSIFPEQFRQLYFLCLNDTTSGAIVADQLYQQFSEIRQGTFPDDQPICVNFPEQNTPVKFGFGKFWRIWIQYTDQVLNSYRSSNTCNLIIHGHDDFNVPVSDTLGFTQLDPLYTEIKTYPGINHFLTSRTDPQVNSDVLSDIASWIKSKVITSVDEIVETQMVIDQIIIHQENSKIRLEIPLELQVDQVAFYNLNGKIIYQSCDLYQEIELDLEQLNPIAVFSIMVDNRRYTRKVWMNP